MTLLVEPPFSEWSAKIDATNARIVEAGTGAHVVALGAGFAGSPAHRALAQRFHVIAFEAPELGAKALGETAAAWIASKRLEKVGLLAIGACAPAALWAANSAGETLTSMVFVAPQGLPLDAAGDETLRPLQKEVQTPKAVLIGTDDPAFPQEAVAKYKRALSKSNIVLVFGAGADIAADRPEALANVAGDFFDRQARFNFVATSIALL